MLTRENALTFWETRYHDQHTPWDRGAVSPALTMWLTDGTLARCSILVPGCGHGYEVVELARRGFAVTAVDIAPAPCAVLRAALRDASLAATVLEADLLDWHPPERFAAVYEQTCLCALAPDLWPRYAEQMHAWLRPGGRLFACFMQTGGSGGPPFDCPLAVMRRLFPSQEWGWPQTAPVEIPHPAGIYELALVLTRR